MGEYYVYKESMKFRNIKCMDEIVNNRKYKRDWIDLEMIGLVFEVYIYGNCFCIFFLIGVR